MSAARRAGSVIAVVAIVVAAAALALLLASGPGTRMGWWSFRAGLAFLPWVAYGGLAGAGLGLIAIVLGGARAVAAIALVLGLGAFAVPWTLQRRARSVPPIHDITTDPQDPPRFVAVLARRAGAANPPEYGGAEIAAQQKRAYPDIVSIVLPEPPDRAFDRAVAAARSLGWEIVATEPKEGRLEATDTTRWFGFKDDIVVRVRPDPAGSRIDVRSESRVGRSDVGTNAARIRRFRSALRP
jgi:uncharacterized protein (DUF1499 family)